MSQGNRKKNVIRYGGKKIKRAKGAIKGKKKNRSAWMAGKRGIASENRGLDKGWAGSNQWGGENTALGR